jgi:hypothetical protein
MQVISGERLVMRFLYIHPGLEAITREMNPTWINSSAHEILLVAVQSPGTAGVYEFAYVQGVPGPSPGWTLTLSPPITNNYPGTSGGRTVAVVVVHYNLVDIQSGNLSVPATGVLAFRALTSVNIDGNITVTGMGHRCGVDFNFRQGASQLENGFKGTGSNGGGEGLVGTLTRGGDGGGMIYIALPSIRINGGVLSNGLDGESGTDSVIDTAAGAGAGSGGSIWLCTSTGFSGNGVVAAIGGLGGASAGSIPAGGDGGNGRIRLDGPGHETLSLTAGSIFMVFARS